MPSAVNMYAYSISQTWDPGGVRATESLFSSVQDWYRLKRVVFRESPLGETFFAH